MNNANTKLFIFTLPQKIEIEGGQKKLICNVVVMPRFSPVLPLAEMVNGAPRDFVPFAASKIQFDAFVVKGHELLPRLELRFIRNRSAYSSWCYSRSHNTV
jgi:hypothetical protein